MWKHGAYEGLAKEFTTIDDLIDDLMAKQARLSALLDRVMDVREAMMLVSLHSQNAARLGKLMLDKKALQKDARDEFEEALDKVLEEITEELGLRL
jgi:NAD+--asparagine ADP-ribosyltransferase